MALWFKLQTFQQHWKDTNELDHSAMLPPLNVLIKLLLSGLFESIFYKFFDSKTFQDQITFLGIYVTKMLYCVKFMLNPWIPVLTFVGMRCPSHLYPWLVWHLNPHFIKNCCYFKIVLNLPATYFLDCLMDHLVLKLQLV